MSPFPSRVLWSATLTVLAALELSISIAAGAPTKKLVPLLPTHQRNGVLKSPAEFFGFEPGDRHLRHDQVVSYFEYLASESDRAELIRYGRSHGRRPLLTLAVSSPDRASHLDTVRDHRPAVTRGEDGEHSEDLLVMYMGYGVHGDEASAMNAAPLVAWHLTSSEDASVAEQLSNGVYLIDPALNPDGNDRFANWANENRGRFASDSIYDREHNQPWPGGRTNYYWFDLNRDWLPTTHPESRGRLKLFHQWKPNVVLDFHEMSSSATYFFQPGIPERNNPLSPKNNLRLTREFAKRHAETLDQAGELYFSEERYDDFYPGKGSTYPDLHGAVGILFEQGSSRGKRIKEGPIARDFRDSIANQVRTSLSSLASAVALKGELLDHQREFYANAARKAADDPIKAYVLAGTPSRISAAAQLLHRHDIESYQPAEGAMVDGRSHPAAHVLVVPTEQPEYTFIKSLMTSDKTFRENLFYDVSTWHLPSALDLQQVEHRSDLPESWLAAPYAMTASSRSTSDRTPPDNARSVGVAIAPQELGAPRLIVRLMRMGAKVSVLTEPITTAGDGGRLDWPRGTYLVLQQQNAKNWEKISVKIAAAAGDLGIRWKPLSTAVTVSGPDLGSGSMLRLPQCKPLLLVGPGTSRYSAGSLWHLLDVRLGQPTLIANASDLGRSGLLDDRTCVVLPSGTYSSVSQSDVDDLKSYVRRGGTVIAIGSAIRWLDRKKLISLADTEEDDDKDKDADGKSKELSPPAFSDAEDMRALEEIAGAFFATRIDPTHPLAFGFPDDQVPVFRDHRYRFPLPKNPFRVAARYDGVIAGYVSKRNREQLDGAAAVWAVPSGSGRYILLADEPAFRGYVRSSERYFTNALLLGPELTIPAAPIE